MWIDQGKTLDYFLHLLECKKRREAALTWKTERNKMNASFHCYTWPWPRSNWLLPQYFYIFRVKTKPDWKLCKGLRLCQWCWWYCPNRYVCYLWHIPWFEAKGGFSLLHGSLPSILHHHFNTKTTSQTLTVQADVVEGEDGGPAGGPWAVQRHVKDAMRGLNFVLLEEI